MSRHLLRASSPGAPEVTWPPYPPRDETELEKAVRLEEESKAKKVSDVIDRYLELEKQELRKQRHYTKVLLLGQAESGKSTILKNFQIHFAPEAFRAETDAWRAVIHLNLIRSVNFILDLLPEGPSHATAGANAFALNLPATDELRNLRMRLSPLRQVELTLVERLSGNDPSNVAINVEDAIPWYYGRASEVSIRSGTGWKVLLRRSRTVRAPNPVPDELERARQILHNCREDIVLLWADPLIQTGLNEERIVLREQSGFFLDEAARVASRDYEPVLQDILRARLQTIGVEEHCVTVEKFADGSPKWIFYDVGGARGQRTAWVPYFDDVDAILFLCPIAAFNEVLLEDRGVNRLSDSFDLWKTICSSQLLKNTTFILLLNKCDILKAKLESGIKFAQYVKSYKDEPNDHEHVSEYLKRKFIAVHKHHSPQDRLLHVHLTCAVDVDMTANVVMRIRDAIVVKNLVESDYL